MFIYTDGITEARNPFGEFFGLEKLDEVLLGNGNRSARQLLDQALRSLDGFIQNTAPTDDRTLLAISIR